MALSNFLVHSTRIVYALLGLMSVITYGRQRDRVRLDIALAFGLIGAFNALQEYLFITGARPGWLIATFFQLVSIAHAYLILRLVQHFRTVPVWLVRAAIGGLLILFVPALLLPSWPPVLSLLMLAYLAALDIYSLGALFQGALAARGVARRRLQFAALGSGLLAALLISAFLLTVFRALLPVGVLVTEFVAVCSGLAFYVGFAPPRYLRHAWQLAELESYLKASAAAPPDTPVPAALRRLVTAAVEAVGGRAALVLASPAWQVAAATDELLSAAIQAAGQPAEYWQQLAQGPGQFVPRLDGWFEPGQAERFAAEGQSALVVSIRTTRRTWGLLVVLLRRGSLFPDDDLRLLELLSEQISLTIEQQALIGDLRQQTQELEQANRELAQSNRELETSNRELEAFTYSVSHDLRTPLRHIEGFTQLLSDTRSVADAGRHYLDNVLAATDRMSHLIDSMLALSRLGRADLTLTRVPLDTLVQQARADLEPEVRERRVEWQVGALPVVSGDPVLLRQVFTNLLSNALKYTRPRPDARIEIGTLPARDEAVVFVRDNGVGFDPRYAHRLFTVFQRLHHPSQFEGDGIGLANVRRIVQRHGGRVWAESTLDAGATFFVALPLESLPRGQVEAVPPASTAAAPSSQPQAELVH